MLLDLDEIQTLKTRFSKTHPDFQEAIRRVSERSTDLQPLGVFALWRKYSEQCTCSDQSPVFGEFVQWYAKDLSIGPNINDVIDYAQEQLA